MLVCLHIYILAVDIMEPVLEWAANCCCLRSWILKIDYPSCSHL